jgi:hypothetical protein
MHVSISMNAGIAMRSSGPYPAIAVCSVHMVTSNVRQNKKSEMITGPKKGELL